MLLLNFFDSCKEVLVLALLLRLQLRESLGVVEHLARVLVSLMLNLVLLLVEELLTLNILRCLGFFDLADQGLLLVVSLSLSRFFLSLFLGNGCLLGLDIYLDVDIHVRILLRLILALEVFLFLLEGLNLVLVRQDLL